MENKPKKIKRNIITVFSLVRRYHSDVYRVIIMWFNYIGKITSINRKLSINNVKNKKIHKKTLLAEFGTRKSVTEGHLKDLKVPRKQDFKTGMVTEGLC